MSCALRAPVVFLSGRALALETTSSRFSNSIIRSVTVTDVAKIVGGTNLDGCTKQLNIGDETAHSRTAPIFATDLRPCRDRQTQNPAN